MFSRPFNHLTTTYMLHLQTFVGAILLPSTRNKILSFFPLDTKKYLVVLEVYGLLAFSAFKPRWGQSEDALWCLQNG